MENLEAEGFVQEALAPMAAPIGAELFSMAKLERSLEAANNVESLLNLHGAAAAMQELAKQMKIAHENQRQLAELQLRLVRKLGGMLKMTVRRGGSRANSYDTSLLNKPPKSGGLPDGITWEMSARYQKVAEIPEEVLEGYVRESVERRRLPSIAGALRLLKTGGSENGTPRVSERPKPTSQRPVCEFRVLEILEAAQCVLNPEVDAYVGEVWRQAPDVDAARVRETNDLPPGVVLVDGTRNPAAWIPKICEGVRRGKNSEVIVVLPSCQEADWFRRLDDGAWFCCFIAASPHVVGYRGPKKAGFRLAFSELGTVFGASHSTSL